MPSVIPILREFEAILAEGKVWLALNVAEEEV